MELPVRDDHATALALATGATIDNLARTAQAAY
jgi:hypothetical protein